MTEHIQPTDERAFEKSIELALIGSTSESRKADGQTDVDAQRPSADQYYWGKPSDMDKKMALDLRRLWHFLRASQQKQLDDYKGGTDLKVAVERRISKMIESHGIIDVLRQGVDVDNIHLTLFYPKPSPADSAKSHANYALNEFSLIRQQTFSVTRPGLELDMALFVNGIPLFTFELKNPWTHQTARVDGIKQYKENRDPRETILSFGRCLAHFVVDQDEVFFCTHLAKEKSFFMPFNQGLPNGAGQENPANPNGFKTSYLWKHVLQKDVLADIIMNYVLFDYGEAKTQKKVPHVMKNAKVLIFPCYHQLDVVDKAIDDVRRIGVGKTYLIQHSAGSGKSNSITWLAFKLIKACPQSMEALRAKSLDAPLFNSVIIVTDRRVLDRQITDNIKAFGQTQKIIQHADSSAELKRAIEANKRIIITTIQKFPFICDTIKDVSDHNFAILIDEAHSSQSGIAADKLNATVQKMVSDDGEMTTDAVLTELMLSRKMSTNCSYFAFTATPKKETLERFGTKDENGSFHPFHLYSMKQAIEEGFILNVLCNYTTYKSYYELIKSTEQNPLYENKRAQKLLKKAVEREPKTIRAKAEQMLAHFDANMFRNHKLNNKAKAMVVTKDIECAIRYYMALNEIKSELRIPYGILIAFSGEKEVDGVSYTETGLNGFPDNKTPEEFNKDENRILVVANKYLTGFDQPKLAAMYIDKPLAGVLAVQCLSRLNRAAPALGKRAEDLFILDFYNKVDDMKASFDPYYTATSLSEPTDVNILHELRSAILSVGVFEQDDIDEFAELYFNGATPEKWAHCVDVPANRFLTEMEWPENGQADFKMKCKQFVRVYSRVAAIMSFEMKEWEKLFWYLRFLIPCLKVNVAGRDDMTDLLDNVDLNTYGLRRTALNQPIELDSAETTLDPNKAAMAGAGSVESEDDPLEEIVKIFNEGHFRGWDATPDDQKAKLVSFAVSMAQNSDYKELVVGNQDPEAVKSVSYRIIDELMTDKRKGDTSLYTQYQKDADFRAQFRHTIMRMAQAVEATPAETILKHVSFTPSVHKQQ